MAAEELIDANAEHRSRYTLETSGSATPRSPPVNASPARTTEGSKENEGRLGDSGFFVVFC
jgi:hypothetical protein